jgi:hypothetical protein
MTVLAAQSIRKGEVLTHCYVDLTRGTFQRRRELLEDFYLSCTCRRCMDPAEGCTFFSALKCPRPMCKEGQLIPANPLSLDLGSAWLCNYAPKCDFVIGCSQVLDLLRTVHKDLETAAVDHSLFLEYENLQKVLNKYRAKILHPNHFLVMDIQYAVITAINKLLELVNEEEAIRLSHQQVELCRSCLDVVDVLRPGNNRLRGKAVKGHHTESKQKSPCIRLCVYYKMLAFNIHFSFHF